MKKIILFILILFLFSVRNVMALVSEETLKNIYYYCPGERQSCKKGCLEQKFDTTCDDASYIGYESGAIHIGDVYTDQCSTGATCTAGGCYCDYNPTAEWQCNRDCQNVVSYCDMSGGVYTCVSKIPNCPIVGIGNDNCNSLTGRCSRAGVTETSKCFDNTKECNSKCCKSYWSSWSDNCTKKCGQTRTRTCVGGQSCVDNLCTGSSSEVCPGDDLVNLDQVELDSPIGTADKPVFLDKPVILKWKDIADETEYRIEIYDQNNSLVKRVEKITGTSYQIDNTLLSNEKIYHWRVQGINTDCDGIIPEQIGFFSDYGYFRLKHKVKVSGSLYLADVIVKSEEYDLEFNHEGEIISPEVTEANDIQYSVNDLIWGYDYSVKFIPKNNISVERILLNQKPIWNLTNNTAFFNLENYGEASLNSMVMNFYLSKINEPWYQVDEGGVWAYSIKNQVPAGNKFANKGMVMGKVINCEKCEFYNDWRFEDVPGPKKLVWGELMEFLSRVQGDKDWLEVIEGDKIFENNSLSNGFKFYAVKGNVIIKPEVTNINGIIIAMGNISANEGMEQLTINGLLFANGNIVLKRDDQNNNLPGVRVIYHPEYLFYLPSELFVSYANWKQGI